MHNFTNIFPIGPNHRDQVANFEIQRLMSQYNQSEQLASSVVKKTDDTQSAVIAKI